MNIVEDVVAVSDDYAIKKIGPLNLAHMLGMRQINMLHSIERRMPLVNAIVARMSDKQIADQIEVGKEFVCGYRPGIIRDEKVFDSVAKTTSISSQYLGYVKQVLVGGMTLKMLDVNSQQRQIVDQGCISVCRKMADIEAYRIAAFEHLMARINESLKEKNSDHSLIIASMLSCTTVDMVRNYSQHKEIPSFSIAAYYSLLHSFLTKEDISHIEDVFLYVKNAMIDMSENWHFYTEEERSVKNHSIEKATNIDLFQHFYNLIILHKGKKTPSITEFIEAKERFAQFYAKYPRLTYVNNINGVFAISFNGIKKIINGGDSTLAKMSSDFMNKTGKSYTYLYKAFSRWEAKKNAH
ncbi:MAG: hypothetical protein K0U21_08615 [Proteobacteria bacterium]|nr:hypothetical protein [Pseudomonadota bacterium]